MAQRSAATSLRCALSEWAQHRVASTSRVTLARKGMSTSSKRHSSASAESSSSTTAAAAYPFAPNAVTRSSNTAAFDSNANVSQHKARGLMATLQAQLRSERDPSNRLTSFFSRKSKDQIPPGSVLLVETYNDASKTTVNTFSGILIAIRRRGMSTSFILRNIVSKLGVEIRFSLYSPLLKDIRVVQRATAGKDDKTGGLRRARRAKLYYLRNDNRKLAGISKSVAALRAREEAKKVIAKPGRRAASRIA